MSEPPSNYASLADWIAREAFPFSLDSPASFDDAVDRLVASLGSQVELLGLGEALHGGKDILVLDLKAQDYRPSGGDLDAEVAAQLKEKDPAKKFAALRASDNPQAKFLWACFRDTSHCSAYHLESIADTARDVDFAIRWG